MSKSELEERALILMEMVAAELVVCITVLNGKTTIPSLQDADTLVEFLASATKKAKRLKRRLEAYHAHDNG